MKLQLLTRSDGSVSREKSTAVIGAIVSGVFGVLTTLGYEVPAELIAAVGGILVGLYGWFMRDRTENS